MWSDHQYWYPCFTSSWAHVQYLGGEVSVKYAFAVQILQASGDVQRQTDPGGPWQIQITVQQLLEVTTVYVLQTERASKSMVGMCSYRLLPSDPGWDLSWKYKTSQLAWKWDTRMFTGRMLFSKNTNLRNSWLPWFFLDFDRDQQRWLFEFSFSILWH